MACEGKEEGRQNGQNNCKWGNREPPLKYLASNPSEIVCELKKLLTKNSQLQGSVGLLKDSL